ncbi:MAG: hypothetical protein HQ478_13055 [Chloroflexi bacterium]|nr:hypothetical protein [Chloroflexota bacterium]
MNEIVPGDASQEIVSAAFEHLLSVESFAIKGEFDAWSQRQFNDRPGLTTELRQPHEIHGHAATVSGIISSPDRFDLKFVTEAHSLEPFLGERIVTPEERANIQDGVRFDLPVPVEVPASTISVTAAGGQISSDQPDYVPRDATA